MRDRFILISSSTLPVLKSMTSVWLSVMFSLWLRWQVCRWKPWGLQQNEIHGCIAFWCWNNWRQWRFRRQRRLYISEVQHTPYQKLLSVAKPCKRNYGVGGLDWLVSKILQSKTRSSIKDFQIKLRAIRAVASWGGSGARPPIWNWCPPISRLAHRLLHTSNTVFLKCGHPFRFLAPPSGFWPPCC